MQRASNNSNGSMPLGEPTPEEIESELERIVESPFLQSSERRRAFLRFIVEEALAGRSANLKGYTIAVSVFGRDESFDAQSDPIVRVEARRLRRDLDSYYMNAGNDDAVRISIPKGSYVPHFERLSHESTSSMQNEALKDLAAGPSSSQADGHGVLSEKNGVHPARFRYWLAAGFIMALVIIAFFVWWEFSTDQDQKEIAPTVVVLPFKAQGFTENSDYLASGITQELVFDLWKFPGFRVYDLTAGLDPELQSVREALGRELESAYVISGSVSVDETHIRVLVNLLAAATNQVLWSQAYDRALNTEALFRLHGDLAGEIATEMGQPYGVVNDDLFRRVNSQEVSNLQGYICVLRAYDYRRSFDEEKSSPLLACLEKTVRDDPLYSDAWAMLGWLHLDVGRFGFTENHQLQEEYEMAYQAASRAVELNPENTLALKALSSINYYMGRYEESEHLARKAVALNPNDPDTLAQLGWRLAARGNFDEGIPILRRAIERTLDAPGWYYHFIAINLYRLGEYDQMLSAAERSARDGSDFSEILIAIASGALEDRETARRALLEMSENSLPANDLVAFLRRHGCTEEIVEMLVTGMDRAKTLASD